MSNLYIRVRTSFFSHRKTAKLRSMIGDAAYWVPLRLWAYCAENQPDGDLSTYGNELEHLLEYRNNATSNAISMLQALKACGFIEENGMIHAWEEHNGYHAAYSERAKKAAEARWSKKKDPQTPKEEQTKTENEIGKGKVETSNAWSIAQASPESKSQDSAEGSKRKNGYHKDARAVLHVLNEASGMHYREVDTNLGIITQRLNEPEVTFEGVKAMILRQALKWPAGDKMREYLRPATLFCKSKFDGYYAAKDMPVVSESNAKPTHQAEANLARDTTIVVHEMQF